jgi:hypothetical protein
MSDATVLNKVALSVQVNMKADHRKRVSAPWGFTPSRQHGV